MRAVKINIVLYSIFREILPPEKRGRTVLELPEGSTIADIFNTLEIKISAVTSINGAIEHDLRRKLKEGDEVQIFRPVGGG